MADSESIVFNTTPKFNRDFGTLLLQAYDNPKEYGVHLMFDDFWRFAAEETTEKYLADFDDIPHQRKFIEGKHDFSTLEMGMLEKFEKGTLGYHYLQFMLENDLSTEVVHMVKGLHLANKKEGKIDSMPHKMHLSLMRFIDTHDLIHTITGYHAVQEGEVGVTGFCLAQFRFPYFAMWASVMTGRMAFLHPSFIEPIMNTLAAGWRHGQQAKDLQFVPWEERLGDKLEDIRKEFNITPHKHLYGDLEMMAGGGPKFDRDFAELFYKALDDPKEYSTHQLFESWWRYAEEDIKEQYVAAFNNVPEQKELFDEKYHPDKVDMERLKTCPAGSLGQKYFELLNSNNAKSQTLNLYKETQEKKIKEGDIVGMPDEIQYAAVRMAQSHDIMNLLTGYQEGEEGSVGLIGFTLAQTCMPYPAMWVSILFARMTFLDPSTITKLANALFDGWERGKSAKNIQYVKWEDRFNEQISDIRAEFGITVEELDIAA